MNKKGFTLVEIVATVSVTALIVAFVLMPHFQKEGRRAKENICVTNLVIIDKVKSLWALREGKPTSETATWDDLVPDYIQKTPFCPSGGEYRIGRVDEKPTCTIEGHKLQ
jgi:prepilin-type N-terminal cleavage/methylation domain-containing protein